jgi:hypothetical protein
MNKKTRDYVIFGLILWLLYRRSSGSSAVSFPGTTVLTADGVTAYDEAGNCFRYYAAENSWYPCG